MVKELISTGVVEETLQHKVCNIVRAKVAKNAISRDWNSGRPANFNGKSMIQSTVFKATMILRWGGVNGCIKYDIHNHN